MTNTELLSTTKKLTVLYAEDDLEMRKSTTALLKNFFSHVYTASDGREALAAYKNNLANIDLVITDILMPHLNGIELTKEILSINIEQKFIVISAYNETSYFIELINTGAVIGFLQKPIKRQELLNILTTVSLFYKEEYETILPFQDGFLWNRELKKLFLEGKEIILSANETKLLDLFLSYPNTVFSAIDLHLYLFEDTKEFSEDSIKSFIKRLRKKIPSSLIQTHKDLGYSLSI
ncbi:response regulator transcription factor [Sulfurimonas sp. NWX367]|uniref:response regulator transcription factor n=1 Tax=unclassified Sulfurimonas TaxID=2623549 RepID=UPI003204C6A7